MRHTRAMLFMLVMTVSACELSSCSSATTTPFGGVSLPVPRSACTLQIGTPPVSIALTHVDKGTTPFVPVCVDGKGPYQFLLDTGAPASVVDTQLADALDLPAVGALSSPVAIGCGSVDRKVLISRWTLGEVGLAGQTVFEASLPGFGLSRAPAGVLGNDVLGRFGAIRVDYRARKLTVLAPEGPPVVHASILRAAVSSEPPPPLLVRGAPRAEAFLTVLKSTGATYLTTSVLLGAGRYSAQFAVDTGSPVSSVSSSTARTAGLSKTNRRFDGPNVGCPESVGEVRSGPWSMSLNALTLAPRALASVDLAGAARGGVLGTIGSDVLSSYGSVVIDYRTGILWLGTG